jgi:hypothetical protein
VVETFSRATDTTKRRGVAVDPLQILALGGYDETGGYDEKTDEDNETEDCDSQNPGVPNRRCANKAIFAAAGCPTPACRDPSTVNGPSSVSTNESDLAADLLQVQRWANTDTIYDCGSSRPSAVAPGEAAEASDFGRRLKPLEAKHAADS